MSKEMREHINRFKNFLLKETFIDLDNDSKKSFNEPTNKDDIDFTKQKLTINDGFVKNGLNIIYLDGVEVGSFVVNTIGLFNDIHNEKTYDNSVFLQGGFSIKNDFKYMGIGKETVKLIFKETNADNIFLYAVDWQGAIDFWKKIGGDVIFKDNELNLIKIKNPHFMSEGLKYL